MFGFSVDTLLTLHTRSTNTLYAHEHKHTHSHALSLKHTLARARTHTASLCKCAYKSNCLCDMDNFYSSQLKVLFTENSGLVHRMYNDERRIFSLFHLKKQTKLYSCTVESHNFMMMMVIVEREARRVGNKKKCPNALYPTHTKSSQKLNYLKYVRKWECFVVFYLMICFIRFLVPFVMHVITVICSVVFSVSMRTKWDATKLNLLFSSASTNPM